jgi:hypothetical protein
VQALATLERSSKVSGSTLRTMEGMTNPDDLLKIVRLVNAAEGKVTVSTLRDITAKVQTERWWTWLLTHPQLTDEDIHPTRRMLPLHSALGLGGGHPVGSCGSDVNCGYML